MLLTFSPKRSTEANVGASLISSTTLKYGRSGADTVTPACHALSQLRDGAVVTARDNRARELREASLSYLRALTHIDKIVRPPPRGSPDALQVSWEDAFAAPRSLRHHTKVPTASSHSFELDKYAMIFNFAAAECGLAVLAERSAVSITPSNETLRIVAAHFQRAAGALQYLSQQPSVPVDDAVTDDLTREALVALEHAMLANAQAMSFKMATNTESMSHSACARVAAGARDLCEVVVKHCNATGLRDSRIHGLFGLPAQVLYECWNAESHCRVELGLGHNMKERLARIRDAAACIDRASRTIKFVDDEHPLKTVLESDVSRRQESIRVRSAEIDNENRRIYHANELQTIPNVSGRVLVKALPFEGMVSEEIDPRILLFDKLEESEVSELTTQYETLTLRIVDAELHKLETAGNSLAKEVSRAENSLSNVQLGDESDNVVEGDNSARFRSADGESSSDAEAVESVRNAKILGGLRHLEELRDKVKLLSRIAEGELHEIDNMLMKEAEEDATMQGSSLSGYRQRPASDALTAKTYKAKLEHMRDAVNRAKNADVFVEGAISENSTAISAIDSVENNLLDNIQLEDHFPNTGLYLAKNQEQDAVSLRGLVRAAKELLQSREKIARDLESAQAADNVGTSLSGAGGHNAVDSSLAVNLDDKYGSLKACVATFEQRAASCEELLQAKTNKLDVTNRNVQTHARTMTGIYKHLAAAKKYFELQRYLKEGISFYSKENDAIRTLRTDVADFAATRAKEPAELRRDAPLQRRGR